MAREAAQMETRQAVTSVWLNVDGEDRFVREGEVLEASDVIVRKYPQFFAHVNATSVQLRAKKFAVGDYER